MIEADGDVTPRKLTSEEQGLVRLLASQRLLGLEQPQGAVATLSLQMLLLKEVETDPWCAPLLGPMEVEAEAWCALLGRRGKPLLSNPGTASFLFGLEDALEAELGRRGGAP